LFEALRMKFGLPTESDPEWSNWVNVPGVNMVVTREHPSIATFVIEIFA
jgi:hypothetical protein